MEQKARLRVEEERIDESLNPDANPEILRIHNEITQLICQAEKAAEVGDIDKAQDIILGRYDDLLKEKANILVKNLIL